MQQRLNNGDRAEMVFTGLTRAKENVVVFLEDESRYLEFFTKHLAKLEVNHTSSQ